MDGVDLNLVRALDALLAEGSVVGAARRLKLSTSAMSRTLARLRDTTGDPLLVRAGRKLVLTPHAAALREKVGSVTLEAEFVLQNLRASVDPAALDLTFTICAGEWFMEIFSSTIVAGLLHSAPGVRLRFMPKHGSASDFLRDGSVQLEIGKLDTAAPEIRSHFLFRDRYVGAVRKGHPILDEKLTPDTFVTYRHITSMQLASFDHLLDAELKKLHLKRDVHVIVPGFPDALRIAAGSDLIAVVPQANLIKNLTDCRSSAPELRQFEIPVRTPHITVSAMWHPRADAEPSQRWLRQTVIAMCKSAYQVIRLNPD